MAQIDLKDAVVVIRDGYDGPSPTPFEINNGAGYMTGATTITIDGGTGIIQNFDRFLIAGETPQTVHSVTAHVETGMNTTSLTFTPALAGNVADNADLTILPHQIEVVIGEGNLTYTETVTREYVRDRGRLDTVRDGDEEPVEVSMDFTWEFLRADTGEVPTVEDVLKQRGEASLWVSSSDDPCEPYAVDIEIHYDPPCVGFDPELITLQDFRYESLEHDLREGQVSVSGRANVTEATVTRPTTILT